MRLADRDRYGRAGLQAVVLGGKTRVAQWERETDVWRVAICIWKANRLSLLP